MMTEINFHGLTKPYDKALTVLTTLDCESRKAHGANDAETARSVFLFNTHVTTFCTPTGRLRYIVGLGAKPVTSLKAAMALLGPIVERHEEAQDRLERTIRMVPNVNYVEGHAPTITLDGQRLLRIRGTYKYLHVGSVPRGQSARQETGGPLVEGPWAFTFGKATVLMSDRYADLRRRHDEEMQNALVVHTGDKVWVDGVEYIVNVRRGEYIDLVPA